jgi:hypothetical protein
MDTSNIKPNSHRYREEQKRKQEREKAEKVITGNVKTKKKSALNSLISEDASSVKSYIFTDVLMPALQKLVVDIVKDGIDIVIYGGTRRSKDDRGSFRGNYVNYSRFSDRESSRSRDYVRPRYQVDDIILDTRTDAEMVLDTLEDWIERYDEVSVAAFYEMVNMPSSHTDEKYGWTSMANAKIERVRDGYELRMPRVRQLD